MIEMRRQIEIGSERVEEGRGTYRSGKEPRVTQRRRLVLPGLDDAATDDLGLDLELALRRESDGGIDARDGHELGGLDDSWKVH